MTVPRHVATAMLVVVLCVACSESARPRSSDAASTTASSAAASSATAPTCNRPHASGQATETFDFQGQSRTYELYVPAAYDGTAGVPLVFNFHGFGSNAKQQMAYGNFVPLADRDGFIIVAPDGQGDAGGRHFNLSGEPGLQDDIAMVNALLDDLEASLCIDAKRVFSTGMSDGGATTSVLACRQADRFAAFAPVAVILFFPGCGGAAPVAFAGFMGTDDPVVPFNGGQVRCCGQPTLGGAPDAMAKWADHDGCNATFTDTRLGTEVRRRTWTDCKGGEVVFYIIDGGGHTWPGSISIPRLGLTTTQLDASATIWDFFKAHPKA